MKRNYIFLLLLTALMLILNMNPMLAVAAEGSQTAEPSQPVQDSGMPDDTAPPTQDSGMPVLTARLVSDGDQPGLYITLDKLPKGTERISLYFSFNGETYYAGGREPDPEWSWVPQNANGWGESVTLYVCGPDKHPLYGYLAGSVENLFLEARLTTQEYGALPSTEFRFSHGRTYQIPQTPPPFSIDIKFDWRDYPLYGTFTDFPPNVDAVIPEYSWDGVDYEPITPGIRDTWRLENLGHPDPAQRAKVETIELGPYMKEPMKSFLAYERDAFSVRLKIETLDGQSYYSQAAQYVRKGTQPLPPDNDYNHNHNNSSGADFSDKTVQELSVEPVPPEPVEAASQSEAPPYRPVAQPPEAAEPSSEAAAPAKPKPTELGAPSSAAQADADVTEPADATQEPPERLPPAKTEAAFEGATGIAIAAALAVVVLAAILPRGTTGAKLAERLSAQKAQPLSK